MENIADDVRFEIFLRLPLKAIFKFKSVSKVWFSTLSSPNFIHNWYKLNLPTLSSLPWGIVCFTNSAEGNSPDNDNDNNLRRTFAISYPDSHSQFVSQHQNGFSFSFLNPISPNSRNVQERTKLFLLGSSNGLLLCYARLSDKATYCVCNPITQKWVSLPPPPSRQDNWARVVTGLMCNDKCLSSSLVSTSFKVIRIPHFAYATKEFDVEMFSSDLGEWIICHVACPGGNVTWNFTLHDNLITHNGVFYWFQKRSRKILAVSVSGDTNDGSACGNECRLINLPDQAMDGDIKLRHRLGESAGLICYAVIKKREKSLSVWVLEEDWCLLYKDYKFYDMLLVESESLLIGEVGEIDLITQIKILGFSPVDNNVVILSYGQYIWAYNTRTKGYEPLSHPYFLRTNGSASQLSFLTFVFKSWPTVLPTVSWLDTCVLDDQHETESEGAYCHIS